MSTKINSGVAIKSFFNTPGYPEVTTVELKELITDDKASYTELGDLCNEELVTVEDEAIAS